MADPAMETLIADLLEAHPPRAGSFIITLFGDSISGTGNAVGLASLIELLEPFGLNARQIRTAVFRLSKDGWLECEKIGRKSFYRFTDSGRRQFERSARRIYAAAPDAWDGQWTLVVPAFADGAGRENLKRALSWLGFGAITGGVLAHPNADRESLAATLEELGLVNDVVVLRAHTEDVASAAALARLTRETWCLDEFESRYRMFIERFEPALELLDEGRRVSAAHRFQLQTLLIHEYRRILLKLTDLPDELLPAGWSGRAAMELTARLYDYTRAPAAGYLAANLETPGGTLNTAGMLDRMRFAGA